MSWFGSGCLASINDTIDLFQKLEFCISSEKSVLSPTKTNEYFGKVIDTMSTTVCRVLKITTACSKLLSKSKDKIREVARVIGLMDGFKL